MSKKFYKSFGYKAIQVIVLSLYSILLIPILLTYWDLDTYGAWIAIYAFFNIVQVVELGHSVYVGNEFNRIVHTDKEKAQIIIGSALRANIVAGGMQVAIVVILYYLGIFPLIFDTTVNNYEIFLVLLILTFYKMIMGSYRGILVKLLNPFGLIYKSFQFAMIEKILEFFILVIGAITGISLVEVALLWLVVKFIYSLMVLHSIKKMLPEYFPWWRYGTFSLGIKNFKKSLSYGASNFMDRLGNDGIVLVVSALVGTSFLPLFSATRTIINFGLKLSDFFLQPLTPEIINQYALGKLNKILDIFRLYWFLTGIILMGGFTLSLFFMEDLFEFWTNNKLEFNLALYSALAIIFLVQDFARMIVTFFTGINKTKIVLLTSIIRISLFFGIAIFFREEGLYGVLLALFVSELIVVTVWLLVHSFKIFSIHGIDRLKFMLNLIASLYLGVLFYLNYIGLQVWIVLLLFTPILAAMYYQFTMVSSETRGIVFKSFRKLSTFTKKK